MDLFILINKNIYFKIKNTNFKSYSNMYKLGS